MRLNTRGQVSFEILLITMVVFTATIWVSSYYFAIKDSTLAMQLTKIHALKQIEESDSLYTIEKIDFEEQSETEINLTLKSCPNSIPRFDTSTIQDKIAANTKYTAVSVTVSQGSC